MEVLEGHGHGLERQHHALSLQLLPADKRAHKASEGRAASSYSGQQPVESLLNSADAWDTLGVHRKVGLTP